MDIQRLRNIVFEKTGIKIDEADPVLAVVALNEALLEEFVAEYAQALTKNNSELDERIGHLVVLHRQLLDAAQDLAKRAEQAHLTAALKAAAEARVDIMNAARNAVSTELEKAADIVTTAVAQIAATTAQTHRKVINTLLFNFGQCVLSGVIGAVLVLTLHPI